MLECVSQATKLVLDVGLIEVDQPAPRRRDQRRRSGVVDEIPGSSVDFDCVAGRVRRDRTGSQRDAIGSGDMHRPDAARRSLRTNALKYFDPAQ